MFRKFSDLYIQFLNNRVAVYLITRDQRKMICIGIFDIFSRNYIFEIDRIIGIACIFLQGLNLKFDFMLYILIIIILC